jgi:hypothetical protein
MGPCSSAQSLNLSHECTGGMSSKLPTNALPVRVSQNTKIQRKGRNYLVVLEEVLTLRVLAVYFYLTLVPTYR